MIAVQISDRRAVGDAELLRRIARRAIATSVAGGDPVGVVLLRDPGLEGRRRLDLARRLREATGAAGVRLWIADRLDVATLVEADGVHLGARSIAVADARRLLPAGATFSVACHGVAEVVAARDAGADACLLSPIFLSPGKGAPLGLEALRAARAALGPAPGFALIALGGVDEARAAACMDAGADGVAAIRADLLGALVAPRPAG